MQNTCLNDLIQSPMWYCCFDPSEKNNTLNGIHCNSIVIRLLTKLAHDYNTRIHEHGRKCYRSSLFLRKKLPQSSKNMHAFGEKSQVLLSLEWNRSKHALNNVTVI